MKTFLNKRIRGESLTKEEAQTALLGIGRGEINNSQIAAFLTSYMMKSVTVHELEGFRDAMLELAISVDLSEFDPMDVCGTGGDGKDTFNISTTSSFILAGAGQNVAKHGNHGVSSSVGSSTVLEYLGVKFTNDYDYLRSKIEHSGICFLHAPLFHPAMRFVGPIRKELGLKTFFNMLGPILNPAKVEKQITGVYNEEILALLGELFGKSSKNFGVIYALDGYDEISLTGDFKLITKRGTELFSPESLGFSKCKQEDLHGGSNVEESAKILISILENKGTKAQTEAVLANTAAALYCADETLSISDSVLKAKESLESGRALESFKRFIS
ncbi:anthranilate phosphoribosyltransferase [Pseudarcicella hirudinis]|uniref:Anthranilate phosphoribosyltransferase n=1 Tax=Pseudarcicella hirudinis TaxID=1079859 RepID=A0A1I5Q6X4_9BACT|nr:anthranilate phosphoribosyltransferase [Pseudarcicella hirudinis]SFP42005.1 anthranilate phosphoribosyltransferase [Pseudarcicella hirudinis]